MDKRTFLSNLDMLGMSQAQFARVLGIDPNTVSRWQSPPSYAVAYLRLALSVKQSASLFDT